MTSEIMIKGLMLKYTTKRQVARDMGEKYKDNISYHSQYLIEEMCCDMFLEDLIIIETNLKDG